MFCAVQNTNYDENSFQFAALTPVFTVAGTCDKDSIKQCLLPTISYLQEQNVGKSQRGLFLTSLEHYMMTLKDAQEDVIHISSLNTILTKIDEALLRPLQLREACG